MNTTVARTEARCGAHWLQALDPTGRTALLVSLLSRFNHDLRTPLNTILGWTHLLQKGGLDPVRIQHVADVIGRNSRDQTQLLEEFVDDGRAILGVLQLQSAALQIDEAVGQAIDRVSSMLTLHGVFLQSKLATADVSVNGDARRLTRLAYRLLAIIVRRAREASTIEVESAVNHGACTLSLSGSAYEPDWSDAALLDLRISTLIAALHDGELHVGPDTTRPCIELKLPRL
ncbi:MAG: histidine kinase dimerization/phospho-acceptor domain-containing protein [Burkholderiaceae bacterium]